MAATADNWNLGDLQSNTEIRDSISSSGSQFSLTLESAQINAFEPQFPHLYSDVLTTMHRIVGYDSSISRRILRFVTAWSSVAPEP